MSNVYERRSDDPRPPNLACLVGLAILGLLGSWSPLAAQVQATPPTPADSQEAPNITAQTLLDRINQVLTPSSHSTVLVAPATGAGGGLVSFGGGIRDGVYTSTLTSGDVIEITRGTPRSDGNTVTVKAMWQKGGVTPTSYRAWLSSGRLGALDYYKGTIGDVVLIVEQPTDIVAAQPLGYQRVTFAAGDIEEIFELAGDAWSMKRMRMEVK